MKISLPPVGQRAWSYSRYGVYKACPRQWMYKFIERRPTTQGPAAARGEAIHKHAELFVAKKVDVLDPTLERFSEQFHNERKLLGVGVEEGWAFTSAWEPTGWFAKDAWCRIKVDLVAPLAAGVVRVTDHKTGRVRDRGYGEQLELYALGAMLMFDDVEEVVTTIRYIDHGIEPEKTYRFEQVAQLKNAWTRRVHKLQQDMEFRPTPGEACRWCDFAANKGGPCEYDSRGQKTA